MPLNIELLGELSRVFDWQPDPAQYFATSATELARQGICRGLETGSGVLVLTGAAGAGKTLLMQLALQDMHGRWPHLGQLSYTSMSGAEILRSMAYAFGMPAGQQTDDIAPLAWTETRLRHWADRGEASLLVVDEAQNLPLDALQPLLTLSQLQQHGRPLMRMLLVGRPPLLELLNTSGLLASSAAALGPQFLLSAFQAHESAAYIADRLAALPASGRPVFSAPVLAEIHTRAHGRPGQIKLLCKQLLETAILLEDNTPIDVRAVATQADELGFHAEVIAASPAPRVPRPADTANFAAPVKPAAETAHPRKSRFLPIAMLLLMALGGAGLWLQHGSAPTFKRAAAPAVAAVSPSAPPPVTPEPVKPESVKPTTQAEALPLAGPTPKAPPPAPQPVERAQPAQPSTHLAVSNKAAAVQPSAKAENSNCAHLLTQLSLGEPLTPGQQRTLESKCR